MKKIYIILSITVIHLLFTACEKDETKPDSYYSCQVGHSDSVSKHPRATTYQEILNQNRKKDLVGAVLLIKDEEGLWMGSSGKADIASNINMQTCNIFLIASISKVFTASAVYRYVDKGILNLEDPISKWLSDEVINEVENAQKAEIRHLLAHTSGIADFYTIKFELDRLNRVTNNWSKEDVIKYVYGKKADFEVGKEYEYSNTNFLLLSMILEKASGLSFKEVYEQEVFNPLNLTSAYYSRDEPIPVGTVVGYTEYTYGSGHFHNSRNLYEDELGIGGDGGIAINAYDLALFLESIIKGRLFSNKSLKLMTNWFDLEEDDQWEEFGQTENGYGLEKFNTQYGYAVGHTGSIDGFNSYGFYFPESDMTYILLVNSTKGDGDAHENIFKACLKEMFE